MTFALYIHIHIYVLCIYVPIKTEINNLAFSASLRSKSVLQIAFAVTVVTGEDIFDIGYLSLVCHLCFSLSIRIHLLFRVQAYRLSSRADCIEHFCLSNIFLQVYSLVFHPRRSINVIDLFAIDLAAYIAARIDSKSRNNVVKHDFSSWFIRRVSPAHVRSYTSILCD